MNANRSLLLLRHAQAVPFLSAEGDIGRSLTEHGVSQAKSVGVWMAGQPLDLRRVFCSPARRTKETLAGLSLDDSRLDVQYESTIFNASLSRLLQLVDQPWQGGLLLIGHNPGLEELLNYLVDSSNIFSMQPASLAWLSLAERDQALEQSSAHLKGLVDFGVTRKN